VARNPRETGWHFSWGEEARLNLYFRLTVPRSCHLDLKLGAGTITVGPLAGRMRAEVENGKIFFRRVDGSVEARVESGDIIVSHCTGAVTARAMGGVMRLGTIGGPLHLRSTSG